VGIKLLLLFYLEVLVVSYQQKPSASGYVSTDKHGFSIK